MKICFYCLLALLLTRSLLCNLFFLSLPLICLELVYLFNLKRSVFLQLWELLSLPLEYTASYPLSLFSLEILLDLDWTLQVHLSLKKDIFLYYILGINIYLLFIYSHLYLSFKITDYTEIWLFVKISVPCFSSCFPPYIPLNLSLFLTLKSVLLSVDSSIVNSTYIIYSS